MKMQKLMEITSNKLNEISPLYPDGVVLTLVATRPGDEEYFVVVSGDDLKEVYDAIGKVIGDRDDVKCINVEAEDPWEKAGSVH